MDMFSDNPFKTRIIEDKVPEDSITSVYKVSDFIDLCRGPHLPHSGLVKAFKLMKNSAVQVTNSSTTAGGREEDASSSSHQRIYGVSYSTKSQMKEYLKMREEALKRDHRLIGKQQELFFWNTTYAAGSTFFLPHGTIIYNKLTELIKQEYSKRGFKEVKTPNLYIIFESLNLYNIDLWKVSGHYRSYKEDLYLLPASTNTSDDQTQGLKPMNCPGHCLLYANQTHSYRDLPIKIADFGALHRNELSGALSGLTRVRRFQQDDAHIFCRPDQLEEQISDCMQFLDSIYSLFGFEYEVKLATRPEDSMGGDELWERAESQLKTALDASGKDWSLKEGDGAFYGPKIDIQIKDALGRAIQCGTIQLDFQLPIRFNLSYTVASNTTSPEDDKSPAELLQKQNCTEQTLDSEVYEADEYSNEPFEWKQKPLKPNTERPVMIHRAIFGSVERFIAIKSFY